MAETEGAPAPGIPLKWPGVAAGIAVFLALAFIPSDLRHMEGFGARPAYAAATTALMAVWWLTEALPIHWTACAPLILFPMLGVFGGGLGSDLVSTAEPFVDAYIFLFLGGMAIGAAMEQSGLHRRIALKIMRAIGTEPKRLLLGVLVASASISLWISNTATAVMMLPIAIALLRQIEESTGRRPERFGMALMLSVAYGANVGGIGTKIGTGPNSVFSGFAAEQLGRDISFVEYIVFATPLVILLVPISWAALWWIARNEPTGALRGEEVLKGELSAMGPMSRGERTVAIVFFAAASLWIFGDPVRRVVGTALTSESPSMQMQGKHYEAGVAMLAALALLALRSLSWESIRRLPWGTLALLGGSFTMAKGIEGSGLSRWLAAELEPIVRLSPFAQIGLASVASVALSAVASNTATLNVMLTLLPRSLPVLFASTMACSCDFALPAGTPPNAIVFGSGYVRLPTMMKVGAVLDLVAAAVITLYVAAYVAPMLAP